MHSLDAFAQAKLDSLDRQHLRRSLTETLREDGIWVERGGRRLLSFSCNDYLNLTQHPAVKAAAAAALAKYGAGSGASRLVTGNHPLYAELESRLARIKHAGIEVMGGFILGFDTDRDDIFDRLVDFIQKSGIPIAMVGLLQALPGTQLFRRLTSEGRILSAGGGNNTGCHLNFRPHMNPDRLIEGYRSVLRRIYSSDCYYQRVRHYLSVCRPRYRGSLSLANIRALGLSILRQGILHRSRLSYWKFVFTAATRHPREFGAAMTMAVMGYHFQTMTDRLLATDTPARP